MSQMMFPLFAADRDGSPPSFLGGGGSLHGKMRDPQAAPVPSAGAALSAPHASSPGVGGQPRARRTDPATAHLAAITAAHTAPSNRMRVLFAHADAGERGLTGFELEQVTGMPYSVIGPRRPALEQDGLIADTLVRRPNDRGNLQAVYAITPAGAEVARKARR